MILLPPKNQSKTNVIQQKTAVFPQMFDFCLLYQSPHFWCSQHPAVPCRDCPRMIKRWVVNTTKRAPPVLAGAGRTRPISESSSEALSGLELCIVSRKRSEKENSNRPPPAMTCWLNYPSAWKNLRNSVWHVTWVHTKNSGKGTSFWNILLWQWVRKHNRELGWWSPSSRFCNKSFNINDP